jgi:hypothetical protein
MKKVLWFGGAVILIAIAVGRTPSERNSQSSYQPSPAQSFDLAVTKIARDHERAQRESAADLRDFMRRIAP